MGTPLKGGVPRNEHIAIQMELPFSIASASSSSGKFTSLRYSNVTNTPQKAKNDEVIISTDSTLQSSDVSDDVTPQYRSLRVPTQSNAPDFGDDSTAEIDMLERHVALAMFRINKVLNTRLTNLEKKRCFRMKSKPDPLYLCFHPGKHDRRKYLNAEALIGPPPLDSCGWSLPVSTKSRCILFFFWIFFAGFFAGMYFFLASTRKRDSLALAKAAYLSLARL